MFHSNAMLSDVNLWTHNENKIHTIILINSLAANFNGAAQISAKMCVFGHHFRSKSFISSSSFNPIIRMFEWFWFEVCLITFALKLKPTAKSFLMLSVTQLEKLLKLCGLLRFHDSNESTWNPLLHLNN